MGKAPDCMVKTKFVKLTSSPYLFSCKCYLIPHQLVFTVAEEVLWRPPTVDMFQRPMPMPSTGNHEPWAVSLDM